MSDVIEPGSAGPRRAARARAGDALELPRLRDVRHRQPRAARRPRRPQARPPPRPLGHARRRHAAEPALQEVRLDRRRRDGQLPPARRPGDLRHPRADGAAVLAALPARRRPGQLRLARRRPAGRDALHRVPADEARDRDAPRHRHGHGRLRAELRRVAQGAARAAGAVPEPARQRLLRDRRRDGHEHAAAQPRRGDRRRRAADRQARGERRRPDEAPQAAPTSRPARSSSAARGSATPTAPAAAASSCAPAPTSRSCAAARARSSSPSCRTASRRAATAA